MLFLMIKGLTNIIKNQLSSTQKIIVSTKPRVFFVLGGPACGKGTQCTFLEKKFGFKHISAGDCLREERSTGSKDAELINQHITDGTIVPNEITMKLLKKKMEKLGWEKEKFLIDGYPRNQENFEGWLQYMGNGIDFQYIILFNTSDENLFKRGLLRAQSQGRVDDKEETIKKRIKIFNDETSYVINYYKKQGKVLEIDGNKSKEEVSKEIEQKVSKIL